MKRKVTKTELLERVESLEGIVLSLEDTMEFLKRNQKASYDPYNNYSGYYSHIEGRWSKDGKITAHIIKPQ